MGLQLTKSLELLAAGPAISSALFMCGRGLEGIIRKIRVWWWWWMWWWWLVVVVESSSGR